MKNILFYLEPDVELGDALFRFATLRSIILPAAKALLAADPELNVCILAGEAVVLEAKKQNLIPGQITVKIIAQSELRALYPDYLSASEAWMSATADHSKTDCMADLVRKKVGGFEPDVILSYESSCSFLSAAFPSAIIINEMFGAFSRAPFPSLATLDCRGLFSESTQVAIADYLASIDLSNDERRILRDFRRLCTKAIAQNFPFKRFVDDLHSRFDAVVLLACQIDGYFAYDRFANHGDQYSMVRYVLQNLPSNVGVVVTEHGYRRQIDAEKVQILKNEYPNFVYFENESNIPGVSQFLAPYVDGVASVSSSLAYQAALWQKPYYSLGRSQVDVFSCDRDIKLFAARVLKHEAVNFDALLYGIIAHLNFSYRSQIFNGSVYLNILRKFWNAGRTGSLDEVFCSRKSPDEMRAILLEDARPWLLTQEMQRFKPIIAVDHLRVSFAECKAVSFDLFDTLAERDVVEPHELFLFIEPRVQKLVGNKNFRFHHFRRVAEADARRPTNGEFEITLDQIYERFEEISGIPGRYIDAIKKLEIDAEKALVRPKSKMIREYKFAKLLMDVRSVITDIYLPGNVIEDILDSIGVVGYDHLLVSAEEKTRKQNGSIYPGYLSLLSSQYGIQAQQALHVGDNEVADGTMAKRYGMRHYVFPKAMQNYKRSQVGAILLKAYAGGGVSSSIMNGMIANRFYSASWNKIDKDSLFDGDPYRYGFQALGPLVLGFTQWLYRRAKLHGQDKLYFLARDGWVLKQAYDLMYGDVEGAPISEYLYCSRRAVMVPSLERVECIFELASQSFNARPLNEFLDARFGLEWNREIESIAKEFGYSSKHIISPHYEQVKLMAFLERISALILENARVERIAYLDYLDSIGFVQAVQAGGASVVDIGYSGSMQLYLQKMLNTTDIGGFYFLTHHHARDLFNTSIFEGFLQNLDDHKTAWRHPLNDHVFIFEAALSSLEGSVIRMTGKGTARKIEFLEAEEEAHRRFLVANIHRGTVDFIRSVVQRFDGYRFDFAFSPMLSSGLMFNFASSPAPRDAGMFVDFQVENIFGGGSVSLIANAHGRPVNDSLREHLLDQSKWKRGAAAIYAPAGKEAARPKETRLAPTNNGVKANHAGSMSTPKSANSMQQARKNRKLAKFRRNPYLFFSDSKKPALRRIRHFFNTEHMTGRMLSKLVRAVA
ncbi:conserved protein of unknown function (plasmid) [Cupriavidus taiwanensis]|uniref:Hydrolase (HAD superfamily) n=1 Tax=Cupriavidus taiwanensis TaxID=164546 RepID=A0A9Q7V084_9BURK|nr:hypothetical protein [Cupriavidus taiwanensis]SPD67961.1 conserved protein of unknown function [Cupriavidus taiwanensis]